MNSYSLLTGLIATLLTGQSIANKTSYGVGVAVNDSLKIYIPINTEHFLIEPTLVIIKDNNDVAGSFPLTSKTESIQLGIGIFKKNAIIKNTNFYYGARFGHIKNDNETVYSNNQLSTSKDNGFFIAPTIGAEYFIINNFSIGLDLSARYSKTDGETITNFSGIIQTSSTNKTTTFRTAGEVILRYHF